MVCQCCQCLSAVLYYHDTLFFTMKVTITKTNLGPSPINYLASEPMRDGQYPPYVYATGPTRESAILSCLIKKDARESLKQKLDEVRVSVLCRCEECFV